MSHSSISLRNTVSGMSYSRLPDDLKPDDDDDDPCNDDHLQTKKPDCTDCQIIKGSLADETYYAVGYRQSSFLTFLFHLFGLLSFGFVYLLAYWRPDWKVFWTKRRANLNVADALILKDIDGVIHVAIIQSEEVEDLPQEYNCLSSGTSGKSEICFFTFQYLKYVWNTRVNEFQFLVGIGKDTPIRSLLKDFRGYSFEEQAIREKLFGKNCISIEVKSYLKLLFTEVLNPFYIFQIASLILWASDDYYLYAICIFLISCLSIGVTLFETRKQSENLKSMVEASNANHVLVLRAPSEIKPVEVDASSVVPGDIIVIPPSGGVMGCDAVLISGNAIVNESMLTGESVPVTKTPLSISEEAEIYSPERHKRHTLFCGTNVIQTRYYGNEQVLAIVVRIGFNTAKGELVRSILYPRPIDFKFYEDSMKFIGLMFFVSMIGMSYSLYIHITRSKPLMTTIVRTLDIVTIVVPPALPAAMTVGTYYAQNRLKKLGIFCISPPRINVCGKLKLVCFDKTGTLTEDGLDVWGVVGVERGVGSGQSRLLGRPCYRVDLLDHRSALVTALATCHSLTYINGQLTGDPLDIQMFKSTKWDLVEPEKNSEIFDSLIPTLVRPSSKPLLSSHYAQITGFKESYDECSLTAPKLPSGGFGGNSVCFNSGGLVLPDGGSGDGRFRGVEIKVDSSSPSCEGVSSLEFDEGEQERSENECKEVIQQSLTIEQIMTQMTTGSDNFDQIAPTVVKPCLSESYVDPPNMIDVTETSFKVPYEIGVVRQFPFSSSIQRMSVVVRVLGSSHMELYCKGAPEVIQLLCKPDTLPENLSSVLTRFTVQGFRVIALAHRNLEPKLSWHNAQRIKRKQIECDLTFLGLLILQNVLKPETSPVICQLKQANIRTVMVTGDNILTGICVARDCGMVNQEERVLLAKVTKEGGNISLSFEAAHSGGLTDTTETTQDKPSTNITVEKDEKYHLAVTGSAWAQIREFFPEFVPYIVSGGTIFGRMSPDQKVQLVEELQGLEYVVGMCGDGANDCGALKAAHVGISLSEAEASVAAPFTSNVANITCVPKVICEGRGALTTNFSVFKYMTLYSIIQFVSILILYSACTNLSDAQFLYIDLFIVTLVAVFMGYTKAKHKLVPKRPLSNLIGPINLFSVLIQILLVIAIQTFAYFYLVMQPWYDGPTNDCSDPDSDDEVSTWETNVIFCVSTFQYLSLGIIYSPGYPFREPFYTNVWLLVTIAFFTLTSLWLLLYPPSVLVAFMELKSFPDEPQLIFRGTLFTLILLHFVLGWSIEYFVCGSDSLKKLFRCLLCKRQSKNLFKRVRKQVDENPNWPPISDPVYSSVAT